MKKQSDVFQMIEVSMYAALIVVAIYFVRIPMPTAFVHPGNALVILALLLMGFRRGVMAAMLGLFIFDATAGYITSVPFTLLENFLVLLVIEGIYRAAFKREDYFLSIVSLGILGAVTKIVAIFIKHTLTQLVLGSTLATALTLALSKMPASFITGVVTAVLVPMLYYPMKKVFERFHPINQ